MRSKKILMNALFGMAGYLILMVSNFITRSVLINQLGMSIAGVDTTFKNFLQVLSLAELGLSTGLIYKLYKPLEQKDNAAIKRVLNFYKRAYQIIAAVFMGGAFILAFAVGFVVHDSGKPFWYIWLAFLLYAADTVASYLFANRKALIVADQNNYLVNRNDAFISLIVLVSQVTFLYLTGSFLVYAVVKILCRLLGACLIGRKFKKMYPEIAADKSKAMIEGEERRGLIKNMGAMLCHRIGGVSVTATGSAIISAVLGTVKAGVYGNYTLITNTLAMLVTQVFNGITASYGNVVTVESNETVYKKFNQLYFFNYLIYSFFTVSVAVLIQPFIRFWIGGESENFFPYRAVVILLCYFYVHGMRRVVLMTKDTVGLYRPDRFFALIEAAINIVLSLVLVTRFKTIDGLILANLLSMLLIPMWTQPYLVYKHVLKKSVAGYYLRYAVYAALTAAMTALTLFLTTRFITVQNILLELLLKALVCLVVPNGLNLCIFAKTPEMQDLITMGKSLLKRKRG